MTSNLIIEIVKLKNEGLTIKQISDELNLSFGKVQYHWNKYRKNKNEGSLSSTNYNEQKNQEPIADLVQYRGHQLNIDQCKLMVQSPTTLFGYWQISQMKKNLVEHHLNGKWVELQKKIRIYDITAIIFNGHNAHRYHDFFISESCNEWFFNHLKSNRTYCIDVGVVTREKNFFSVLRSNPIDTPRVSQCETGLFTNAVSNWKDGQITEPEWLEGFSSYSYYEKIK